jgi:hypothetical protein
MLGFIVPFKAKSKSKNWSNDCLLLAATLRSIENQTSDAYHIFVVYTDYPENNFKSEKVQFIQFPYLFVTNEELNEIEKIKDPNASLVIDERMFDQGKRILYGCIHARKCGCDYVMSIDSDDLVSNRIASYVRDFPGEKIGWYVNKGYILQKGSSVLLKVNKNMNYINASTHIVHIDLVPEVNFESKRFSDFSFFSAHGYLKERIKIMMGATLKPLPFFGLIYFIHDSNWADLGTTMKKHWIKTIIKYLVFGKRLNSSVRKEFGLNG